MAASANMFCIPIDYKTKVNMKVAASNKNIKIHRLFSKQRDSWFPRDNFKAENLWELHANLLLNNV